jgi:hypothetical protein
MTRYPSAIKATWRVQRPPTSETPLDSDTPELAALSRQEELVMRRFVRLTAIALAMAVVIASQPSATSATSTAEFYSSGCYGVGNSKNWGNGPVTETISYYWQCGYYYLSCAWQIDGSWSAGCPGWVDYPITVPKPEASAVMGWHSLCDAGGTCPGYVVKDSHYPPQN